jgi:acetyl esterase/lipase
MKSNVNRLMLSAVFALASTLAGTTASAQGVAPAPLPAEAPMQLPALPKPVPVPASSLSTHEWIPLWPQGAPGQMGKTEADIPAVSVYLPPFNPTKTFVVVAPGGGYTHLALDHEGAQVAQWLNAHGVGALVLRYRLGPTYHHPIEIGDAQRAIRFARSHAAEWGVQTDRVGMWGFSAGGHLTATAGTHFDAGKPGSADPLDSASSRPDFMVLAYPVISFDPSVMHAGSRKFLLGDNPDPALVTLLSNELQVTPQTPPTFIFSTSDDATVPIANSILFYSALVKNKVPVEMHIYQNGKHGAGLAQGNPALSSWPGLLYDWMRLHGWAQ